MIKDLTKGSIPKHIKNLAIPAAIGFIFQVMYNIVDTIYASSISTESLAAMTISFPIFMTIISLGVGIGTGASVLVANSLGEKNKTKASTYAFQAIIFTFLFSLIVLIFGPFISKNIFLLMNASQITLNLGLSYIYVIIFGTFFLLLSHVLISILTALGDSKSFRNILIIGFFLNLLFDPWFMYGWFGFPKLGLAGIALATVLIQLVSCIYLFIKILNTKLISLKNIVDFKPKLEYFKNIFLQGFPASMNLLVMSTGLFIINLFLGNYGDVALASYGVISRVEQVLFMPTIGLNIAVLSIVGQNNGARNYKRIVETIKTSVKYGIYILIPLVLIFILFPDFFLRIFTKDLEVIKIGIPAIRIITIGTIGHILFAISNAGLQGLKKPMFVLWGSIFRQIVIPLICIPLFLYLFNNNIISIWFSILIGAISSGFIALFYFKNMLIKEYNLDKNLSKN